MTWNPAVHELTFLCSHCGWHPDNTARWCGSGCGSDYNRMIPTERAEALGAAGMKVRELDRWRRDSLRHRARAEDRVRELEAALAETNEHNMMEACDECNGRLEAAEAALEALHAAEPSRAENAKLRARAADLEAAILAYSDRGHRYYGDLPRLREIAQGGK